MALETSISSENTHMAKTNAINSIVEQWKVGLDKLKSWITSTMAKVWLVWILTFWATEAVGQSKDVALGGTKSPAWQVDKKTVWEDPIKDSVEYKKERERLLKEWEEVMKLKAINEKRSDQRELLLWPMNFFNRIQEKQWGVITERDGKFARNWLRIIEETEWLPELMPLAEWSKKILQYIASQAPQPVITKN